MDDSDLLHAYSERGSEEAFAELVRKYVRMVYFTGVRQVGGDFHLAEDVTQLVFTKLARKAPALARRASIAGWLYVSARLVASQVMRAERRRQVREDKAHLMNELTGSSEPQVEWERLSPMIDKALDSLSERDREIVLLRFFHGSPFAEIGAAFGLSADAARFRLDRAVERMRITLARRGINSSTAVLAMALASQAEATIPTSMAATVTGSALASASTGAASGAGLAGLLGAGNLSLAAWVGILSLAGILGTAAIYEWNAARDARAALAVANHDYDAQWDRMQAMRQAAGQAERQRRDLARTVDSVSAKSAEISPPPQNPKAEAQRFLAAFPEAGRLVIEGMKIQIELTCDAFFKSGILSPEQIRQFEELYAESTLRNSLRLLPGGNFALDLQGQELADIQGPLRKLFGDKVLGQFQEFMRFAPARKAAAEIAAAANDTPEPLSAGQVDGMIRIEAISGTAPHDALDADSVEIQARSLLSETQWGGVTAALLGQQFGKAYNEAKQTQVSAGGPETAAK